MLTPKGFNLNRSCIKSLFNRKVRKVCCKVRKVIIQYMNALRSLRKILVPLAVNGF